MTDVKDVRETLRERARDARVMLMDAHPTMSYEDAAVVALLNVATEQIDNLTRERDEALVMLGWTKESSLWQAAAAANQEVGHIRADWLALKAQLAAARVLLKSVPSALNAAFSAGAEERENGSDRRQEKQMETVYAMRKAITAALTQGDA